MVNNELRADLDTRVLIERDLPLATLGDSAGLMAEGGFRHVPVPAFRPAARPAPHPRGSPIFAEGGSPASAGGPSFDYRPCMFLASDGIRTVSMP